MENHGLHPDIDAKIIDAFDAPNSKRPSRQKTSMLETVDHLHGTSGILFDPTLVDKFEKVFWEIRSGSSTLK
jgi:response regulator RpfG family c-di-GMP phosphodiesterase